MEDSFNRKDEVYKRERTWLIFAVIIALLGTGIVVMSYMNIKQKRRYEKLLFTSKREELAFINSHDVRKHLSNILGIIGMIKQSENRDNEYQQAEPHLFCAAENLDKAIKNIAEKLDS